MTPLLPTARRAGRRISDWFVKSTSRYTFLQGRRAKGARTCLLSLPPELLIAILRCLDVQELFVCQNVCRIFFEVCQIDIHLRYGIELAANGMVDGPPSDLPVHQRLAELQQYARHVQGGGDTVQIRKLSIPNPQGAYDHLSYLIALWQASSPILTIQNACASAVDENQGLYVYGVSFPGSWNVNIKFRNQNGTRHPRADQASLSLAPTKPPQADIPQPITRIKRLEVYGPYIAVVLRPEKVNFPFLLDANCNLHHSFCEVQIWDWMTGKLVWSHIYDAYKVSVAFLDDANIIVCHFKGIFVYPFRASTEVVQDHTTCTDDFILHLCLPEGKTRSFHDRYEWEVRAPHATPALGPFCHDPSLRTFVINIRTHDKRKDFTGAIGDRDTGRNSALVIPASTFRALIQRAMTCRGESKPSPPHGLRWEEWGPGRTLLLNTELQLGATGDQSSIIYIVSSGSKVTILVAETVDGSAVKPANGAVPLHALVYDLNPAAVIRAGCVPAGVPDRVQVPKKRRFMSGAQLPMIPHTRCFHASVVDKVEVQGVSDPWRYEIVTKPDGVGFMAKVINRDLHKVRGGIKGWTWYVNKNHKD